MVMIAAAKGCPSCLGASFKSDGTGDLTCSTCGFMFFKGESSEQAKARSVRNAGARKKSANAPIVKPPPAPAPIIAATAIDRLRKAGPVSGDAHAWLDSHRADVEEACLKHGFVEVARAIGVKVDAVYAWRHSRGALKGFDGRKRQFKGEKPARQYPPKGKTEYGGVQREEKPRQGVEGEIKVNVSQEQVLFAAHLGEALRLAKALGIKLVVNMEQG